MSSVKVQGNASGTGIFTITSPNSNNTQTITLPDATTTMVGTDTTDTLTNKTLTTPTIATIKSASTSPTVFQTSAGTEIGTLCRAWVQFAGASGTRNGSFNVSSVTRSSTGRYTINFTNALPDGNYAVTGGHSSNTSWITTTVIYAQGGVASAPTASSFIIETQVSGALVDPTYVNVLVFR